MKTWRCTCPDRFPLGSPGYRDVMWRDGQYVQAESLEEAQAKVARKFPGERVECQPFMLGAS